MVTAIPQSNPLKTASTIILIGVVYYFAHHAGFLALEPVQRIATIWPASGLALAIVLLTPRRLWRWTFPALAVANIISNTLNGNTFIEVMGFLAASMLELGFGVAIMLRLCDDVAFRKVSDVMALLAVATVANGGVALFAAAQIHHNFNVPFWPAFWTWWISDGLGMLVVTPLVLSWVRPKKALKTVHVAIVVEAVAFAIVWVVISWFVFHAGPNFGEFVPRPYMLLALLAWAALRLGPRGVTVAQLVLAGMALYITITGQGSFPLGGDTVTERLLMVQVFIGLTSVSGLLLATSFSQTRTAEQEAITNADKMVRANRALRTLSNCNQTVGRATSESELLSGICSVIVDDGYSLAWVGYLNEDNAKTISVVAQAGMGQPYLDHVAYSWADHEHGRVRLATAVSTGQGTVCHDYLSDQLSLHGAITRLAVATVFACIAVDGA
jgi:integral membrane sensor domain MASE1